MSRPPSTPWEMVERLAEVPVEQFFGESAILDLSDVPWSAPIELSRLEKAVSGAGGIRSGDMVFIYFDWDRRGGFDIEANDTVALGLNRANLRGRLPVVPGAARGRRVVAIERLRREMQRRHDGQEQEGEKA